jgi:hypothetical protein
MEINPLIPFRFSVLVYEGPLRRGICRKKEGGQTPDAGINEICRRGVLLHKGFPCPKARRSRNFLLPRGYDDLS